MNTTKFTTDSNKLLNFRRNAIFADNTMILTFSAAEKKWFIDI